MAEKKSYYKLEIIEMAERRRFTQEQISCFLNLYDNMSSGYTIDMLDRFEYSVNGPVLEEKHPSSYREL